MPGNIAISMITDIDLRLSKDCMGS